jgi:hypothetical protein
LEPPARIGFSLSLKVDDDQIVVGLQNDVLKRELIGREEAEQATAASESGGCTNC